MKLFVVPVPIFNTDMRVHYYKLMSKNAENLITGEQSHLRLDGAVNPRLLDAIAGLGLDTFTMGAPLIIPVNGITLLADFEKNLGATPEHPVPVDPDKIIIALNESVTPEPMYMDRIHELLSKGFHFAFELPKETKPYLPIIELCKYIIVKQVMANHEASRLIRNHPAKRFIASSVDTHQLFDIARGSGYNRFEGLFYRVPLTLDKDTTNVGPGKLATLQLIKAVETNDFEIDEIASIVEKDVALTVSMLKQINSQAMGSKIKTIQHAAAMLGQDQIKRWVSTAAVSQLGADKSSEINRVSQIRAKFCENLAPLFGHDDQIGRESLFLMGLFSLIDVMLDMSIDAALDVVGVSDWIRAALVDKSGAFYGVYEFIQYYERADWTSVSRICILNNIETEAVYEAYINALEWYKQLTDGMASEE